MNDLENTPLSERELEILRLVAHGKSNKEIALELYISINTVKVHLAKIFQKINVSSRTEATLYAIEHEHVASPKPASGNGVPQNQEPRVELLVPPTVTVEKTAPRLTIKQLLHRYWWALGIGLIIFGLGINLILLKNSPFFRQIPTPNPMMSIINETRWKIAKSIPEPREQMALATYNNHIYAIAGVTKDGVTSITEKYDCSTDIWTVLQNKPTPVTHASAVVVGGLIYVPGGDQQNGFPSDVLEVYNPKDNSWALKTHTPIAISRYAIAALEGNIYLFGGWNGTNKLNTTFIYNPTLNSWSEGSPLPQAKANIWAAQVGDKFFILGNHQENEIAPENYFYEPTKENSNENPWSIQLEENKNLRPIGLQKIGESIFVFGKDKEQLLINLYSPQNNLWHNYTEVPMIEIPESTSLISLGDAIYFMGGKNANNQLLDSVIRYQAVYTIVFPRMIN